MAIGMRRMSYTTYAIFALVLCMQQVFSARVLVLLPPTYSVITPLLPAIEELYTKYGHRSTVVTNQDLSKGYENATFDFIISERLSEFKFSTGVEKVIESSTKGNPLTTVKNIVGLFSSLCNAYLTDMDLAEKLEKESFDIAITWKGPAGICINIIPYKLSIPFVLFGNAHDPINDRIPFSPSFVPHQLLPFSDKMTFIQRVQNTLLFFFQFMVPDIVTPSDALSKYVPEKPYISTSELMRKAELHLIDSDPLMDFPRPIFPNNIYVGGMGAHPAQALTGDLKSFMDSAHNGAVVVSFGSLLKSFPSHIVDALINGFKRLKDIRFVFRHGKEFIQKENILFMPWIPQNDLLGHPNTKVFVTHCGNAGQMEALFHGVPMIGIPVNGDQLNNAKRMESKGYGTTLKLTELTSDQIVDSVNYLLTNTKTQKAIKTASKIFRTRPQSPVEKAAYWIDHVIKYGGQYMRPAHLDMPFYQYVLLDVILFLLFILLVIIAVIVFVTKKICKCCRGRKVKTE